MATFAELLSDTYLLTNRPDLVNETKMAVKAATLKLHHTDFYPKDLYETGISWSPVSYIQSLDYRSLIPRWRSFKFLRKYDATTSTPGDFFSLLVPEQVLDSYNQARSDICYLAGESLEIKSSTQDDNMIIGCYIHPDITEGNFTSWVALDHPYAIVYEAAASLFKMIGYDEQATMMKQMVVEQVMELRMNNIIAGGW